MSVLDLVLLGLTGIATFAVLFVVARVVLPRRGGGGDDIKDVGLD